MHFIGIVCLSIIFARTCFAQLPSLQVNGDLPTIVAERQINITSFIPRPDQYADLTPGNIRGTSDGTIAWIAGFYNWAGLLKADQNGALAPVARYNISIQGYSSGIDTDGRWVAIAHFFFYDTYTVFGAFRVEDDQSISHVQHRNYSAPFEFVRFMPDGSLLGLSSYENGNGLVNRNATIYKFELVGSNWTITDRFVFNEKISFGTRLTSEPYRPAFQLNATHLLVQYRIDSMLYIYEKASNGSFAWDLKTSIQYSLPTNSAPSSLAWNGEDTIVIANGYFLTIVVKLDNGTWTTLSSTQFSNYIGQSTLCINKDTFISSLDQGSNASPGAVYVIKRLQGVWTLAGKIIGSLDQRSFARGIVPTNSSLVFDGKDALHSLPICAVDSKSIDWDCPNRVELDSCAVGQFDAKIVCKSNQPACDSMVTTEIKNFVVNENSLEIDYVLHRFGADSVSHSVTIDCSKDTTSPSVSSSPNQPSTVNSPISSVPRSNDGLTSGTERLMMSVSIAHFLIVLAALYKQCV